MGAYLLMLGAPATGALLGLGRARLPGRLDAVLLGALFALDALLIGLRDGIGADWLGYLTIVRGIGYERLGTALAYYDPAFDLTAWVSVQLGWGLYGVDWACGLLLLAGVFRFARTCPDPWLALCAAVPYLLIVVGMGYIRQAAAIGLVLTAFVHLTRGAPVRFALAFAGALTFHVAALVLLPLVALVLARRNPVLVAATAAIGAGIFAFVLVARLDGVQQIYVSGRLDLRARWCAS